MPRSVVNVTISHPSGEIIERWTIVHAPGAAEVRGICNLATENGRAQFMRALVEELELQASGGVHATR